MKLAASCAGVLLAVACSARAAAPRVVAPAPVAPPSAVATVLPVHAALVPVAAIPAAALSIPASPTPAPAVPAQAALPLEPREWDFMRWSLPEEIAPAWIFREPWVGSARLWDGAAAVPLLGEGAMGSVFVHPARPDAVVKVARAGYAESAGQYMAPDDAVVLSYEDYDLGRLAALGAAPRPLARLTVSGRPASVRERIRGETVAALSRRGRFGPRERGLVDDLIALIAAGGFTARDLNLGNIMIGRRAGDRDERAWLVDTLGVAVRGGTDAARRAEMLAEPVPWLAFQGFGLARPLSRALDASVRRD